MIEVRGLEYTYPRNSEPTIKRLDFDIAQGEIFGFLGPSGAGKSTTQKIIIGLLKGFCGAIRIDGTSLADLGYGYYENIGVSFEFPNLFGKLTAIENLRFFASLYSGETDRPECLLELVGLGDKGRTRVEDFSKGMKMRLNFARSLLNRPGILFLDEPTSGLDPTNAKLVKGIIREKQAQGTTIFLTTHNMNVADELCDRVAFIVEGELPVVDSPRELKIRHGKKIVRVEFNGSEGTRAEEFPFGGIGTNEEFLRVLRTENVETIHSLEATLEDIFIEVTGRRLGESTNGSAI